MKQPKPPDPKTKPLYIRMRPRDYKRMQTCAWGKEQTVSEWARQAIIRTVEFEEEERSDGK